MNHWYEASNSIAQEACTIQEDAAVDGASPWLWVSQIREVLGDDRELDPWTLAEHWASGLPVDLERFRVRREDVATPRVESGSFAEQNSCSSFFFRGTNEESESRDAQAFFAHVANAYTASWLGSSSEELSHSKPGHANTKTVGSADREEAAGAARRLRVITRRRAYDILCVRENSSEPQMKAAYRRMVSKWHPDKMEQRDASVRAFATEQMAAINQAYQFLRSNLGYVEGTGCRVG